jgi:hypothetical protein
MWCVDSLSGRSTDRLFEGTRGYEMVNSEHRLHEIVLADQYLSDFVPQHGYEGACGTVI